MHKITVTNIPRWISEIHLKNFFTSCGKVLHAQIVLDPETLRSLGYGYVIFADERGVQNALAKNGVLLDGAMIGVSQGEAVMEFEL